MNTQGNGTRQAQRRRRGVGFVYDECMTKHRCASDHKHPEGPTRVSIPYSYLEEKGLVKRCIGVDSRCATEEELSLVHSQAYIQQVKQGQIGNPCKIPERWPTYVSDGLYESATCAVGCALNLVDAVITNKVSCGVALVRPPGHHAEVDESCGFCFFNNVAIAARHAQEKYGLDRVLILDWDIHHGNGIQHVFYSDPSVLYISLHKFDNGDYFPHLKESSAEAVGEDEGKGFNVNIPWNRDQMGNSDYRVAFDSIVLPIVNQFQPNLTLVAAGFDAAAADPIGEYVLTPAMYGYMTQKLLAASGGKMALITEGGYNVKAIGECLAQVLEVLQEDKPLIDIPLLPMGKRADLTIKTVRKAQEEYWNLA